MKECSRRLWKAGMTAIIPALAALVACGGGGRDDHSGNAPDNPVNTPPAVTEVAISAANPRVGDTLVATARVNDVDGNLNEVVFAWYLGTALVQKMTVNVRRYFLLSIFIVLKPY